MNNRFEALKSWVHEAWGEVDDIRSASADASFRHYYRVSAGGDTYIVMDAPPGKEDPRPFIQVAQRLHALGLNVPRVLRQDLEQGFLLLSDLGERLYLAELNEQTVERLYGDALKALAVLQAGIFTDSDFLPEYNHDLLMREMELFREWYLGKHLGLNLSAGQQVVVDRAFHVLMQSALEQPQVWVHRDYHSRNLMLTATNNPGILDFQDALRGPVTYDLVSLLRDCYIAWPRARVEKWALAYQESAHKQGLPVGEDKALFLRWFDLMGVQRHLKASGIFARLNHRDGKPGYLADIPRTLGYVNDVSARYPDLHAFHELLAELNIPGTTR